MHAYRLPNGNLLVPRRAEGDGGVIGDAWEEASPGEPEYERWSAWYARLGNPPPELPPKQSAGAALSVGGVQRSGGPRAVPNRRRR